MRPPTGPKIEDSPARRRAVGSGIGGRRRAAAAVELAVMLPVFCYSCLIAIDYSRLFYAWATLADCAKNGAMYASDANFALSTPYLTAQQAALADATNLSPTPTVTTAVGVDALLNSYVEVNVSYTFSTISNYPGIPSSVPLSRKLRMYVTP